MQITSSAVQLAASATSSTSTIRRESLKAWVGDEPPDRAAADPARPALAPLSAQAATAVATGAATPALPADHGKDAAGSGASGRDAAGQDPEAQWSPKDQLDIAILRRTFRLGRSLSKAAREIRSAYADPAPAGQAARLAEADRAAKGAPQGAPAPQRAGWGLRYDLSEQTVHAEAVSFSASAQVTTADGRTIQVQAALAMERLDVTSREVHLRAGDAAKVDPLVLNLGGGAASLGGATAFDLDADGKAEQVAQLGGGSAYLALDKDGNGTIDSGAELFGPSTGSGFGELRALDQDRNGWVDEGDAAFASLRLWRPADGALTRLGAAGVGAIYTGAAATPFTLTSGGAVAGRVAETGLFLREDGSAGTVQHVDLVA